MRSAISERGGNASRAGREVGMEKPKRARRRKLDTAKADLEPPLAVPGGQGVHREVESEGHEEKYRAVIDGGHPEDELVGQRRGKVEPALWRRRRSHSPAAPRCLRTARYGRTTCDLRRTGRVSGWHRSKQTYKRERSREWIVDADLKDFFGSVDHEKLLTLVAQRVSDGRVLRLIRGMLQAGVPTEQGTPQGGTISPLLSNVLLTPFDREMRRRNYRLTRY